MTEEIIEILPDVLKQNISTIKKVSKDGTNSIYMSESTVSIINFDKIPRLYSRGKGWRAMPKSNDALYIGEDTWYFIEFKNGNIKTADIYRKMYDSLIMLIDLKIIDNFEYSRKHINYILVYNSGKYGSIQNSESRDWNYNYILGLAKQEQKLFGIEKFDGYLFNETHTWTKEVFNNSFIPSIK